MYQHFVSIKLLYVILSTASKKHRLHNINIWWYFNFGQKYAQFLDVFQQ